MPQTRVNLPPEMLEAIGDIKGAASAVQTELRKAELEIAKALTSGKKIDSQTVQKADRLGTKLEELQEKKRLDEKADKAAKESVAKTLLNLTRAHSPHAFIGRLARGRISAMDVENMGEFMRKAGVWGAKREALGATALAKSGATIAKTAFRVGAAVTLAGTVATALGDTMLSHFGEQKAAAIEETKLVDRTFEAVKQNRFQSKLSSADLIALHKSVQFARTVGANMGLNASIAERVKNALGFDTPGARKAGIERANRQLDIALLRRTFGQSAPSTWELSHDPVVRQEAEHAWKTSHLREDSTAGAVGAFFTSGLANALTGGATKRKFIEDWYHERELKGLHAAEKKRTDSNWERSQNPVYRNIDTERSLQARTVAQWRQERALQWNPY
ncbi:MAG: hypothetical protein L6R28_14715 [Planctomycetes bacterium]|nr:hypothetical protein [Planctomycetota bacterium]